MLRVTAHIDIPVILYSIVVHLSLSDLEQARVLSPKGDPKCGQIECSLEKRGFCSKESKANKSEYCVFIPKSISFLQIEYKQKYDFNCSVA